MPALFKLSCLGAMLVAQQIGNQHRVTAGSKNFRSPMQVPPNKAHIKSCQKVEVLMHHIPKIRYGETFFCMVPLLGERSTDILRCSAWFSAEFSGEFCGTYGCRLLMPQELGLNGVVGGILLRFSKSATRLWGFSVGFAGFLAQKEAGHTSRGPTAVCTMTSRQNGLKMTTRGPM